MVPDDAQQMMTSKSSGHRIWGWTPILSRMVQVYFSKAKRVKAETDSCSDSFRNAKNVIDGNASHYILGSPPNILHNKGLRL